MYTYQCAMCAVCVTLNWIGILFVLFLGQQNVFWFFFLFLDWNIENQVKLYLVTFFSVLLWVDFFRSLMGNPFDRKKKNWVKWRERGCVRKKEGVWGCSYGVVDFLTLFQLLVRAWGLNGHIGSFLGLIATNLHSLIVAISGLWSQLSNSILLLGLLWAS